MIPRIFVSSTIRDLQHVRDAIRELIAELGYQSAMSEHGEIGYLPEIGAADACYREAKDCDFGILIIGKRYGNEHQDEISVTHNEYRTLRAEQIPIITIVEKDLLSYRVVFEANPKSPPATFPGMDHPEKTFGFLAEVTNSPQNNGIAEFTHIGEARSYVRKQLAHVFGNLLRNAYDPVKAEVKDILAEVRSLRNEITKGEQQSQAIRFLRVSRALLEDDRKHFRDLLQRIFGNADQPVKAILDCERFDDLIANVGWSLSVFPTLSDFQQECDRLEKTREVLFVSRWSDVCTQIEDAGTRWMGGFALLSCNRVFMNEMALKIFRDNHARCRAAAEA